LGKNGYFDGSLLLWFFSKTHNISFLEQGLHKKGLHKKVAPFEFMAYNKDQFKD